MLRPRDSLNLCRIEAVCEQKAAQAPQLFQFIALHGGAKIVKAGGTWILLSTAPVLQYFLFSEVFI